MPILIQFDPGVIGVVLMIIIAAALAKKGEEGMPT